jgi:hypothetical protein
VLTSIYFSVRSIARLKSDTRKHADVPELVYLVRSYIDKVYINKLEQHKIRLRKYVDFTRACASRRPSRPAIEMRRFAIEDKDYPSDSLVSENNCQYPMKTVDQ